MTRKTRLDAEQYVMATTQGFTHEHSIEAIVDDLHQLLGHYDFDQIDHDTYWDTVKKNAIPAPATIQAVIDAHNAIQDKEQEIKELTQVRAQAIRDALDAEYTQSDIAQELNVKQPRIAYMLKQGDKYQE